MQVPRDKGTGDFIGDFIAISSKTDQCALIAIRASDYSATGQTRFGTGLQAARKLFNHRAASALSGKFTPLLRASFRRQLCCATSKDSRHSCVARLTDDENPSRINTANFPDSTLEVVLQGELDDARQVGSYESVRS